MAKMKIFEIARSIQQQDKSIKSGDLVKLLNENGFEVKGPNSNIEDDAIAFLMKYFMNKKKEKAEAPEKTEEIARAEGMDLQVIGIPKTVDNDLGMTDHAPGFGSAARHVAYSVRDISRDLESMRNFEKVRILETMGRNAGWLAAAAGPWKEQPEADG